jgi:hypothetical protein
MINILFFFLIYFFMWGRTLFNRVQTEEPCLSGHASPPCSCPHHGTSQLLEATGNLVPLPTFRWHLDHTDLMQRCGQLWVRKRILELKPIKEVFLDWVVQIHVEAASGETRSGSGWEMINILVDVLIFFLHYPLWLSLFCSLLETFLKCRWSLLFVPIQVDWKLYKIRICQLSQLNNFWIPQFPRKEFSPCFCGS